MKGEHNKKALGSDYVFQCIIYSKTNTDWALLFNFSYKQYRIIVNTTHLLVVERFYSGTNIINLLVVLK